VDVVGHVEDLLERDPTAHTDIDQSLIARMPIETSSGGLNHVVMLASPGVVADSNGFFHPIGDHAQTQFSIDNQPITDQQSRLYSNQISQDAVQSLEVITGVAPAEYGDKSSLVVHIVTKSGLDQAKPSGSASFGYGSFNSPTGEFNLGGGSHTVGNFVSVSGLRTDRFLDTAEFEPLQRPATPYLPCVDYHERSRYLPSQPVSHLELDVPTHDAGAESAQTSRRPASLPHALIGGTCCSRRTTRGGPCLYAEHERVRRPAGHDQPDRTLMNMGAKADPQSPPDHNVKFGERLPRRNFTNSSRSGSPTRAIRLLPEKTASSTGVRPFDLTNGGSPFAYDQSPTVKQQAAPSDGYGGRCHAQNRPRLVDTVVDVRNALQPRLGVSAIRGAPDVLRASYGRTRERRTREPVVVRRLRPQRPLRRRRSGAARRAIRSSSAPSRDSVAMVLDFGYFDKHTDNGYDFGVLFNTPIAFPVAWDHSRINGFTGRVNLVEHNGFSAFVVMAHTNAIYSPPGVGGILLEQPAGDFRIDHDQKFNATTNLQYTFEKSRGAWAALSWRYDSGLVAGAVGSLEDALGLTAAQQTAIGFFCGSKSASLGAALTADDCTTSNYGATRLRIPAEGTEDDVNNPPRIAPRHLFDLGMGVDNLLHSSRTKLRVRFSVLNLTNREALYNFLSTFSGTHFVTPRAYQVQVGVTF
jgi:hypothetical protein